MRPARTPLSPSDGDDDDRDALAEEALGILSPAEKNELILHMHAKLRHLVSRSTAARKGEAHEGASQFPLSQSKHMVAHRDYGTEICSYAWLLSLLFHYDCLRTAAVHVVGTLVRPPTTDRTTFIRTCSE